MRSRRPSSRSSIAAAALGLLLLPTCGSPTPPAGPGVFVLGVDGMDPVILRRLMEAGKMPNLSKLAATGGFQELGTSNPPQSPVAWSNFVTGEDPGGHGIYDFVHRDPKTYLPTSSATPAPGDPPSSIDVFGYYLPIGGDDVVNNRSGTPWWDALQQAGVDVEVYRIPGNYPPTPSEARTLSGMGTVDMRGGYGVYSWFTDQVVNSKQELKGDIQLVTVEDYDLDGIGDTVKGKLKGAPDIFHLPPGQMPSESDYLTASFTVSIDPSEDVAFIRFGSPGDGGAEAVLKEGEWTDWMDMSFDALPMGALPLAGSVRFYAKELRPAFKLYASPVNMSAADPPQPISTPDEFAPDLYEELGSGFYTQGMPEETNALRDGTFTDDDYEQQVHLIMADAERMLGVALGHFQPGDATFFYLSDIDLQCHMLWRHGDPKQPGGLPHPAFEPESAINHADDIDGYYQNVDRLVGEIVTGLPPEALLIVMSDHGFQPFTRKVHLNSWLRDNGWLTLKDGKREGHIAHGDVDWSKTRAYALGFNAIYLNLQGRERDGIVTTAEADKAMAELQSALAAFTDPKDGAKVVLRVDRGSDIYHGARKAEAPDLVVGYDRGYGHSDESTLGELPEAEIEDNTSKWSGNHLMAPEVVPGVLLSNRPIQGSGHDLTDITATLYAWYGLPPHAGMIGQPVLTP